MAIIPILIALVICVVAGCLVAIIRSSGMGRTSGTRQRPDAMTPRQSAHRQESAQPCKSKLVRIESLSSAPRPMFYEPTPEERKILARENAFRKQATAYKRQKQYDKAVEMMRAARDCQYTTSLYYDIKTLLRIPKYLILAGRFREAVAEVDDILQGKWGITGTAAGNGQREARAIVSWSAHEVAADAAHKMGDETLAMRHEQEAKTAEDSLPYMRVADLKDEARDDCWTIGRIEDCGLKGEPCEKWHGKLISIDGGSLKYPSINDVDIRAVFGNDNPHSVYAAD